MNTLQETARAQFENNKRARRHIFAQAAARGVERERRDSPATPSEGSRDGFRTITGIKNISESPLSAVGPHPPSHLASKFPLTSSNSLPISTTSLAPNPRPPLQSSLSSASVLSNGSRPTPSATSPLPFNSPLPLPPNGGPAPPHTISPVATRMRERDADAMAEYMKRTRSGSNPTSTNGTTTSTTSTTDNAASTSSQSSATPIPSPTLERRSRRDASKDRQRTGSQSREREGGDRIGAAEVLEKSVFRPLRRLRPSNSAASLRPTGIIGPPPGHGHSNSAAEIDMISEVLNGMNGGGHTSFLPSLSPIVTSPAGGLLSSVIEGTRPLDIKPRTKAATTDSLGGDFTPPPAATPNGSSTNGPRAGITTRQR